jgi:hypothetical protein
MSTRRIAGVKREKYHNVKLIVLIWQQKITEFSGILLVAWSILSVMFPRLDAVVKNVVSLRILYV